MRHRLPAAASFRRCFFNSEASFSSRTAFFGFVGVLLLFLASTTTYSQDCDRAFALAFSGERIESNAPVGRTPEIVTEVRVGGIGETDVYVNIISQSQDFGVEGWTLSVEVEGDIDVLEATVQNTAGAEVPDGLRTSSGFQSTQVVDPDDNEGRRGVVSVVGLAFLELITLPPVSTHSTLLLKTQATVAQTPEDVVGTVGIQSGLRGRGTEVVNALTVDRTTKRPCEATPINIVFRDCECNTPVSGVPVTVRDENVDEVEITFQEVSEKGITTVTPSSCSPQLPEGIEGPNGVCYDIQTSATFSGPVEVCIGYDDTDLSPQEGKALVIVKCESVDGNCEALPRTSADTQNNIVCGQTDGFSIFTLAFQNTVFLRGDCDSDGVVSGVVSDAVFQLAWSFLAGQQPQCAAACDADGDGEIAGTVSDAVRTLGFNFLAGPPPVAPFPDCGPPQNENDVLLGCETPQTNCL